MSVDIPRTMECSEAVKRLPEEAQLLAMEIGTSMIHRFTLYGYNFSLSFKDGELHLDVAE
jgi:hypothetical protein